jgi:hypothetical protein
MTGVIQKKVGVMIQKLNGVWLVRTQNASFSFDNLGSCVEFAVYCALHNPIKTDLSIL